MHKKYVKLLFPKFKQGKQFCKSLLIYLLRLGMFLNKYKNKRKLGKGGYGDVYLVQDDKQHLFALKLISVRMIKNEPHLKDYINGEMNCMKNLNSPHIIKLYDYGEDEQNIYFVLEYCDGGDLINCQARQMNKVFTLDKATQILAQVIIGLQHLHQQGYLHRDIKPQNILMKNQNGKQVYKVADFGFTKKKADIGGTVLGTDQFMSPEILSANENHTYGYEVDMWAFGVLFYFMLNMEHPFRIKSLLPEKKVVQLKGLAQNFSYSKLVQQSKKKKIENCTPEIQDLFKKIFQLDPDKRITFQGIRRHPIFAKHFPIIPQASKLLYSKKFNPFQILNLALFEKLLSKKSDLEDNTMTIFKNNRQKDKQHSEEMQILYRSKQEIDFLIESSKQFMDLKNLLKTHERFMLCYNITKYYLILLKRFKDQLNNEQLRHLYPRLKWTEAVASDKFRQFEKEVDLSINKYSLKLDTLYENCIGYLDEIQQINPKFVHSFTHQVNEKEFGGYFKESYRKSTAYIYGALRQILSKKAKKGNRISYLITMLVINHGFSNLLEDKQYLPTIFKQYFQDKNPQFGVDYSQLREWMSKSKQNKLNKITLKIMNTYFPDQ